jgi:hypothetical protein
VIKEASQKTIQIFLWNLKTIILNGGIRNTKHAFYTLFCVDKTKKAAIAGSFFLLNI